ncbi:hypothetical protein LTR62_007884 [Meristemomyces frigidus]|uniref:Kri1-like C-terminal domain-containing protein n=1 Tax=Meristemomyces frigidus TaxID=1508187 RepID=A0AAN7TA18_9PEZI|nr:hypothetical protein LTR62_007884 [Meristemomyces frigidus]
MALKERPAKRAKLDFDSDASDDVDAGHVNSLSGKEFAINEDYAKRFEYNKKREEKARLEEKYGEVKDDGGDGSEEDSEDESEDDDAELADETLDAEIFDTLRALKSKDPRIYDSNAKFYRDFEAEGDADDEAKVKKEKPMYLQDYHRQNLMRGFQGDENPGAEDETAPQTYQEEQDAVRAALVGSMHASAKQEDNEDGADEADGFLTAKRKSLHESLPVATTKATKKRISAEEIASADQDPENYLSNFMSARAWLAPNGENNYKPLESDDSEDERNADKFENAFNLRFEDPGKSNETLMSFRRDAGALHGVRREEINPRQRAREREKERKLAEKRQREEERARLKKLKVEEVEEKVKRIKEAAGLIGKEVDLAEWRGIIEGEFEEGEWEVEMAKKFGDGYYEAGEGGGSGEDAEAQKAKKIKKPKWDDDIDINDLIPDFVDKDEKAEFSLSEEEADDDEQGGVPVTIGDDDLDAGMAEDARSDGEVATATKRKTKKDRQQEKQDAKRLARKQRQAIEQLVDASLPLQHPSLAPSVPTTNKSSRQSSSRNEAGPVSGFRYRAASPTSFGLSARDILFADDKQLNEFVGLKKMYSFRDEDKKRKDGKRLGKKGRVRVWRREVFGDDEAPKAAFLPAVDDNGEIEPVESSAPGETGVVVQEGNIKDGERKKKRKRSGKGKKEV